MADFSPEVAERDIQAVSAEVKRHQESPEARLMTGQELVRKSIRSYTGLPAQTPQQVVAQKDEDSVLPAYAVGSSSETKHEVEHLLGLAFREGIIKATDEAYKSSPYVLDIFHDALAGKLYPELQKRGILK
jgi:hypothetical protein